MPSAFTSDVELLVNETTDAEEEARRRRKTRRGGGEKDFDSSASDSRRVWAVLGCVSGVMLTIFVFAVLLLTRRIGGTPAVIEHFKHAVQQAAGQFTPQPTPSTFTPSFLRSSSPSNDSAFTRRALYVSHSPSSPSSSSFDLTPAESEAAWILTGDRSAASKLSSSTKTLLRHSLSSLAITMQSIRPRLQRELHLGYCQSYIACPLPPKSLREAKGDHWIDVDVIARVAKDNEKSLLSRWTEFLITPPTADSLFHSHTSTPYYSPGELAVDQEIGMAWQDLVHRIQHPADCSKVKFLVFDTFHGQGGFGSWSHARALAFGIGIRAGRTVVEAPDRGGYPQAYSDCTRKNGLGGCDIFLPTSSCTVPADWQEQVNKEKEEWVASNRTFAGGSFQELLEHMKDRKMVANSEWRLESEQHELHHGGRKGWNREQLMTLGGELAPFRMMPECWWNRQALAYHMRVKREAGERLLALVGQSLRLYEPNVTAHNVYDYADALAPAKTHTSHWWLAIQGVKLEWQLHQLAPGLTAAMRKEVRGDVLNESEVKAMEQAPVDLKYRVPLLGYSFVRHGDKVAEAKPIADVHYFWLMQELARKEGLWTWYIGADDLLSPQHLRNYSDSSSSQNASLLVYTSTLVDQIQDKEHHRLAGGFVWGTSLQITDQEREAVVWRTWLEFAMAQVADVVVSTWTSNHPRMAYELMGAMSDARSLTPVLALDLSNRGGKVSGC